MRQLIRFCLLAVIISIGSSINVSAQEIKGEAGKWSFVGKMTNPEDTILIIPTDDLKSMNTMVRNNGTFNFSADLTKTKEFIILTPSLLSGGAGYSFIVTAVPGEELIAEGFCDNNKPADGLTFSGTAFYKNYLEALIVSNKVKESKEAQPAIDFIKTHPDSECAAILVNAVGCFVPSRLDEFLAMMSPEVRNGRLKGYIDSGIDEAKDFVRQQEMAGKTLPMGSVAPEFTLDDLQGKPLSLSSLRGKFVVLDFWGSWCGWCIKGFPEMKTYYEKYKGKMEILGMDCNDTVEKWKKAVAEHALPWLHVYVPKGSSVPNDYMITGFPTKIIISPEGKVLTTVIGEDPTFYQMLDELFK